MEIIVKKHTDLALLQWAAGMTTGKESHMSLDFAYGSLHSPARTQMFSIEMNGIYNFVAKHFRTHSLGIVSFELTHREDRGKNKKGDRWDLTNYGLFLNAESLINLSRKRLCYQAHAETRKVMLAIRDEVSKVDHNLALYMVPECVSRGGICKVSCKMKSHQEAWYEYYQKLFWRKR